MLLVYNVVLLSSTCPQQSPLLFPTSIKLNPVTPNLKVPKNTSTLLGFVDLNKCQWNKPSEGYVKLFYFVGNSIYLNSTYSGKPVSSNSISTSKMGNFLLRLMT